ncbi:MAG: hypothetical protein KGZ68_17205 [Dechloromonas sp.]|jgi:hypothetical protein|nr:hypothetical protein [Dechloromonas sp.]
MMIQNMHAAEWLLETTPGRVALRFLELCAFTVGALLMLWVVYMAETRFAPVIEDWKLEYIERQDGHYVLGGTLVKTRACELISTSVMAVPKQPLAPRVLVYQIKPDELVGGNAPTGFSTWGPWRVEIPKALLTHREHISFLEVVGHHRCHGLWTQETLYGRVFSDRLP